MAEKKTWQIDPDEPITFNAALKNEDLEKVQGLIAAAVRQSVLATLEEHGYLERGAPVDFSAEGGKNIIIKPPTIPK